LLLKFRQSTEFVVTVAKTDIHFDRPAWEDALGETDGLIPLASTKFSSCLGSFIVKFSGVNATRNI
jgi:hypothetical protein